MTVQRGLRIAAVVCFALATVGLGQYWQVATVPLGLALWVGSEL